MIFQKMDGRWIVRVLRHRKHTNSVLIISIFTANCHVMNIQQHQVMNIEQQSSQSFIVNILHASITDMFHLK